LRLPLFNARVSADARAPGALMRPAYGRQHYLADALLALRADSASSVLEYVTDKQTDL